MITVESVDITAIDNSAIETSVATYLNGGYTLVAAIGGNTTIKFIWSIEA